MAVPFEALIPYGIMLVMFGVTGAGLAGIRHSQYGGKRNRYGMDQWDENMRERDRRLTGSINGQSDESKAPAAFATNSAWRLEKRQV